MNIKHSLKAWCIIAAVIFIAAFVWLYSALFTSVVPQREGVIFNLTPGMSKKTFITQAATQQLIPHPWIFSAYISFFPSAQLKAGEYLFPYRSTPATIWRQVITATGAHYYAFTIVPGWSFLQLRQALQQADLQHTTATMTEPQIMQALGYPNLAAEGEFYPDTYYFTKNTSDLVILKRAFNLMQKKLAAEWQRRDQDLFFQSPYQALIAASIVEKEAYLATERPTIVGVMINRLKADMLLQFDPTVIYGMGMHYQGKIYKSDLTQDTPYNTYLHKGLTPTPIAMPSLASIQAAMHPQQHHYIYFVARGDGSHQFSETLSEHNAAVASAKQREIDVQRVADYISQLASQKYLQMILATHMVGVE